MATSGKKQLEVILNYTDKLSGRSGRTIKALASVESQAKRTTAAVKQLNKELGRVGGGKTTKGTGRLPTDLQLGTRLTRQLTAELGRGLKLETQQAKLLREQTRARAEGVRLAREEARLSDQIARQGPRTSTPAPRRAPYQAGDWMKDSDRPPDWRKELHEQPRPRRRAERADWPGRVERFGHRAGDVRDSFSSFGSAARTAGEFARPALEQLRAETEFRIMNVPEADQAAGLQSIERTLAEVKGVRRADVIKDLTALVGVTGSVGEAAPLLGLFAQYRAGMEARYGDRVSPEAITDNIGNTMRAIELLGKDRPTGRDAQGNFYTTPQDIERIKLYANMIMKASAASGGDVDPTKFRQFAQYSRTAGMSLSEEGTLKALPLIQQMGGSQAGTALASLQQALIGGQMPTYKLAEWDRMGWITDRSKLVKTKGGMRVQPGGMKHTDKLLTDPTAFIGELEKEFREKQGIDTQDPKAVNAKLYSLFGNRVPMGMVAQAINAQAALEKETGNYRRALDIPGVYADVFKDGNPLGGLLDLEAKRTDAQARAATQTLGAGGGVPGAAADWMKAHPDAAAVLSGLGALAKASTETAEGVGLLGSALKGLAGGGGAGGASGGGGWFGSGYDTADVAGGGWMLGKGLKWGGRAGLGLLGRLGLPGLIAAGGVGSIYAFNSQYENDTAKRHKAEGDAGLSFDEIKRRREAAGGRLPDDVASVVASRAFPGVDRRGLLNELDLKTYGTAGYPGVMLPQHDSKETRAGGFARRAPEMQLPEVMGAWMRDTLGRVQSGQMSKAVADAQFAVAGKAFPDTFKQASAEVSAALGKLPEPAAQTGKALSDMLGPARYVPPSLASLVVSFQSAAASINALEIRAPSIVLPSMGGASGGASRGKPKTGNRIIDSYDPLAGFRARGGPVSAGRTYVVGEQGAELFTPGANGFVTPNHALEGAAGRVDYSAFQVAPNVGGREITVNVGGVHVAGGADPRATGAAVADEVVRQVREALARLAAVEGDLYDPRFHSQMTAHDLGRQKERV
jgi:hypothetical protein